MDSIKIIEILVNNFLEPEKIYASDALKSILNDLWFIRLTRTFCYEDQKVSI